MARVSRLFGSATRSSAGNTNILAAPGAGKQYLLHTLVVTIAVFAASGLVQIDDGTTVYFAWSAVTGADGQPGPVQFKVPFPWGANKAIRLVTTGAITAYAVVEVERQA